MNWQVIIGAILVAAMTYFTIRQTRADALRRSQMPEQLFGTVKTLFNDPKIASGSYAGSYVLNGIYQDQHVELKTITDTLATRKLPSLWLLITLRAPAAVTGKLDLMMRTAGPTTFSNFDFLPHTIPNPHGFPREAALRSDQPEAPIDLEILRPHLRLFENPKAKELLITPEGLRFVIQIGEAERARYAVFRDARFETTIIDPTQAKQALDILLALHADLMKHHAHD